MAQTGFKLGRLARSHNPAVPRLGALLAGQAQPTPPASVDYTANMPANLGMMLNDTLGDCTCAAVYHAVQVWSFNATGGKGMITQPDSDVLKLYEQACGYKPAQGGEGPGGNEQKVLTYLQKTGAPAGPTGKARLKIAAFVEVDVTNLAEVKQTIADCGVCYIGFNVPQFLMPPGSPPPSVWDVQAGDTTIVGGHAVVLAGYDAQGARVISWGQYYTMTWAFFAAYVDEAYAIADPLWVEATGKTPGGLTLGQLEQAMSGL